MFSIADKGDAIIDELMQHFKATESGYARLGIIYTIHLIGIKGKVVGRTYESFKSKKAREALLSLIPYGNYNRSIAKLLMRDPWLSDVPVLIKYLEQEKNTEYTWPFVKSLLRYNVTSFCIGQSLNEQYKNWKIPTDEAFNDNRLIKSPDTSIYHSLKLFEDRYPQYR